MFCKQIIVLTKSAKYRGYCVAGVDARTGEWLRLVSEDRQTNGALTRNDMTCADGTELQIMELAEVSCKERLPILGQPENILIDRSSRMKRLGLVSLDDVLRLHPPEEKQYIFRNRYASVSGAYLSKVGYSLLLIRGENIFIYRIKNRNGQSKLKADFLYQGVEYQQIAVTDPDYFSRRNNILVKEAILILSLGEAYEGHSYKFIAKIFERDSSRNSRPRKVYWPRGAGV